MQINSIEDVIAILDDIIVESEKNNDPMGYFAALYKKVTVNVKDEIALGTFDDGVRMEALDVLFARRYLEAYFAARNNEVVSLSWQRAFELKSHYYPIVLQHLLMGMNAHINLDLGIAAAETAKGKNLADLESDFYRINEILSSLVHDVENKLSAIWPLLKYILKWSGKIDDFLIDFSMKLARDGAWKFANSINGLENNELTLAIKNRDGKVASKVNLIVNQGMLVTIVLRIIRITERGGVAKKIQVLNET